MSWYASVGWSRNHHLVRHRCQLPRSEFDERRCSLWELRVSWQMARPWELVNIWALARLKQIPNAIATFWRTTLSWDIQELVHELRQIDQGGWSFNGRCATIGVVSAAFPSTFPKIQWCRKSASGYWVSCAHRASSRAVPSRSHPIYWRKTSWLALRIIRIVTCPWIRKGLNATLSPPLNSILGVLAGSIAYGATTGVWFVNRRLRCGGKKSSSRKSAMNGKFPFYTLCLLPSFLRVSDFDLDDSFTHNPLVWRWPPPVYVSFLAKYIE